MQAFFVRASVAHRIGASTPANSRFAQNKASAHLGARLSKLAKAARSVFLGGPDPGAGAALPGAGTCGVRQTADAAGTLQAVADADIEIAVRADLTRNFDD